MFGALPTVRSAEISPDGKTLAVLQSAGDASAVLFYDLDDPDVKPTGARVAKSKAYNLEWARNNRLLLLASMTDRVETTSKLQTLEFFRWISVSPVDGSSQTLFEKERGFVFRYVTHSGNLLAFPKDAPDESIFARFTSALDLMRVNVKTGEPRRLERGNRDTQQWMVDDSGEPVIRVDYDPTSERRRVFRNTPAGFRQLIVLDEPRGTEPVLRVYGLAPGGRTFYATMNREGENRSFVEIDLASGVVTQTLFSNPQLDVSAVLYDPRKAAAIGILYIDDLPRVLYFDASTDKLQAELAAAIPGATPIIVSQSDDGSRMVVRAVYTDHPDQYFIYEKAGRKLNMFAPTYAAIDGTVYANKEKFDYAASDGVQIPGYLTVPAGAKKVAMPLVVLPHGGPEGRDDQSFDWWSFFYASQGYLVYQPNFRGSDGYGYAYRAAGYGEWGRRMQADITEGVARLVADGVVDPARVCIVGASYGGYAALAGATLTRDVYACAVSVNGVSNLIGMLGDEARSSDLAGDYWTLRLGSRFREVPALEAVSPAKIADRAGPPVLIIHGRDDTVVPFNQGKQMADALKAAKKPHEFVALDGEDHWLSAAETRTQMLARSIAFIDAHIGAKN